MTASKRKFLVVLVVSLLSVIYSTLFLKANYSTYLSTLRHVANESQIDVHVDVKCDKTTNGTATEQLSYLTKYPFYLDCKNSYSKWNPADSPSQSYNYSQPASVELHKLRLTRAVLVYFPMEKYREYRHELKWLYQSWIYMLDFEPLQWRTDLIVFTDYSTNREMFNKEDFFFNELNCSVANRRTSSSDAPRCVVLDHRPLRMRKLADGRAFSSESEKFHHLLGQVDVFDVAHRSNEFYSFLQSNLKNYGYLDSILMAYEGYEYFKSAGYDFLVRSDMDVFLTPLFGQWTPRYCNDFYVGGGGYSTAFNTKRFQRIAANLGLKYGNVNNLGSTWYSTPDQFRLVSYLTLFSMAYLASEEFAPPEREGKVGTILWPDWHYGVLLLYGQNLALNHLIAVAEINVVKLDQHLDYPSANTRSIFEILNVHVFHGDNLFSKFAFIMGQYDNMTIPNGTDVNLIKFFCLKMALESKRSSSKDMYRTFSDKIAHKI